MKANKIQRGDRHLLEPYTYIVESPNGQGQGMKLFTQQIHILIAKLINFKDKSGSLYRIMTFHKLLYP